MLMTMANEEWESSSGTTPYNVSDSGTLVKTDSTSISHAYLERPRPYKRPYKKSLLGCKTCKRRKIKCDEQLPVCGNCRKRFVDITHCEYGARRDPPSSRALDFSTPAPVRFENQVSFKPFRASDSERLLELRLLHHYTRTTSEGQSLNKMAPLLRHPMWEVDIPQLAFSSEVVLNALMGISALHLLALNPQDRSVALASRSYFNKAIAKQREELCHIDAGNAESLLVAAVLIAHHSWLSAHISDDPSGRYNIDLKTYQMCLGIKALIRRTTPWLEKYSWSWDSHNGRHEDAAPTGFMKLALEDLCLLSKLYFKEGVPLEDSTSYERAAEEIILIYSLLVANPVDISRIEQEIVTIMHRCSPRFLELLAQEDPIAMALLARNICLLSFLDNSQAWWIHGAGQQKVPIKAVLGIRGLMPVDWLWTMEWPIKVITKEITLSFK